MYLNTINKNELKFLELKSATHFRKDRNMKDIVWIDKLIKKLKFKDKNITHIDMCYGECIEGLEELKEYKQLEEKGLLLKLPCKVGTNIYILNHHWIDEGHICGIAESDDIDCFCFKVYEDPDTYTIVAVDEFGVTWFLTEEAAEQELERKKMVK